MFDRMGLADQVRTKAEAKERAAREQSADQSEAAKHLFDVLDQIAPEAVAACEGQRFALREVRMGPTGLTKKGWIIPVEELQGAGSSAIVFYPQGDWDLAEPTKPGSFSDYKMIPRWAAIRGSSKFLLQAEKTHLEDIIADVLTGD